MKVLIIDAKDSFVYTIEQYYKILGAITRVVRVNQQPLKECYEWNPDLLVLGPGPGTPEENGYIKLLANIPQNLPVFGICLGHQAIGQFFGYELKKAPEIKHGKKSLILHDGLGVFQNINSPIDAIRYHSLVLVNNRKSDELLISAISEDDGLIMGIRHKYRRMEGVQFHPESIGTQNGMEIIANSLNNIN